MFRWCCLYRIIHLWIFLPLFCWRGYVGIGCLVIFKLFSELRSIMGLHVRKLFLLFTIIPLRSRKIDYLAFHWCRRKIFRISLILLFSLFLIYLVFLPALFYLFKVLFLILPLSRWYFSSNADLRTLTFIDLKLMFSSLLFICFGCRIFFSLRQSPFFWRRVQKYLYLRRF